MAELLPAITHHHPVITASVGPMQFTDFPVEIHARFLTFLPLDHFTRVKQLSTIQRKNYSEAIKSLSASGDQLAYLGFSENKAKGTVDHGAMSGTSYTKYLKLLSVLRDTDIPQSRIEVTNTNLADQYFLNEVVTHSYGDSRILAKAIAHWTPTDTPEATTKGANQLRKAIAGNDDLRDQLVKRFEATTFQPRLLEHLIEHADPKLTAAERLAFIAHTNIDGAGLMRLAERVSGNEERAAIRTAALTLPQEIQEWLHTAIGDRIPVSAPAPPSIFSVFSL
jgi:hypothetical protein